MDDNFGEGCLWMGGVFLFLFMVGLIVKLALIPFSQTVISVH